MQNAWSGPEGATKAPHVTAFISNFNSLSGWIRSVVVSTRPPIPRIGLLHRFIDVAKCCVDLQNYNGAMAIVGALLGQSIHRLKEDWDVVPKDTLDVFAELQALFATSGNFKVYRAAIAACAPPALPYVGLSLQDLTFLETNKDTKVSFCGLESLVFLTREKVVATMTMVNLEKSERIGAIIQELHRFQTVPYVLRAMPAVQTYLLRGKSLASAEQDALSAQVRPKTAGDSNSPRKLVWKKEFGSSARLQDN